jgi:hypothetical protein
VPKDLARRGNRLPFEPDQPRQSHSHARAEKLSPGYRHLRLHLKVATA